MANKRNRKKTKPQQAAAPTPPPSTESKAAEAATIFWMLCLLALTTADFAACVGIVVERFLTDGGQIRLIFQLLSFVAVILGLIQLATTPLVLRLRKVPPPRSIVCFALIAAGLPWGVLFVRSL